jgi:hypothetical protein
MLEGTVLELLLWNDVGINRRACNVLEKLAFSVFGCGKILWFCQK